MANCCILLLLINAFHCFLTLSLSYRWYLFCTYSFFFFRFNTFWNSTVSLTQSVCKCHGRHFLRWGLAWNLSEFLIYCNIIITDKPRHGRLALGYQNRKNPIFPIGKKGIKFFSGKIKNKRKFCVYLITQADIKQSTRFQYDVIKFNNLTFFRLEQWTICELNVFQLTNILIVCLST